jgi:hypothetical protein
VAAFPPLSLSLSLSLSLTAIAPEEDRLLPARPTRALIHQCCRYLLRIIILGAISAGCARVPTGFPEVARVLTCVHRPSPRPRVPLVRLRGKRAAEVATVPESAEDATLVDWDGPEAALMDKEASARCLSRPPKRYEIYSNKRRREQPRMPRNATSLQPIEESNSGKSGKRSARRFAGRT